MPAGRLRRVCCAVGVVTAVATLSACSDDHGFDVLSPGAVVEGGNDAISLLGAYWQEMLELPSDRVSLDRGEVCDMRASSDSVYIAPTYAGTDATSLSCRAPEDSTIVVMPATVVCVEEGIDEADVACLESLWDLASSSVVVDGRTEAELTRYQVDSEQFQVDLGSTNIVGVRPGLHRAIARGQVVMLEGLSRGPHVIELMATFRDDRGAETLTLELDIVADNPTDE